MRYLPRLRRGPRLGELLQGRGEAENVGAGELVVLALADDVEHLELELLAGFGDVLGAAGVSGPVAGRGEGLAEPLLLFGGDVLGELGEDRRLRLLEGELEQL